MEYYHATIEIPKKSPSGYVGHGQTRTIFNLPPNGKYPPRCLPTLENIMIGPTKIVIPYFEIVVFDCEQRIIDLKVEKRVFSLQLSHANNIPAKMIGLMTNLRRVF